MIKPIEGFSKLSKSDKISWITRNYTSNPKEATTILEQYWNEDEKIQQLHDEFIENTISNYYMPYGIAPNFLINGKLYAIPMAIEESSVVAAASKAAKYWLSRGGFKAEILDTEKIGHVHFTFDGTEEELRSFIDICNPIFFRDTAPLTRNMEARGGGIRTITLVNKTQDLPNYYQLHCTFETLDAMGANFINSCLEQIAHTLQREASNYLPFAKKECNLEVVMSILSNYVPNCRVRASVSCPLGELEDECGLTGAEIAAKMVQAVTIATVEPYRAVTHNKGIMNGVDAVVLATGNDFRAIEAGIHAYASRSGKYTSLSEARIEDGIFTFALEIPLALGTIGGITRLHPLVKLTLEILDHPDARTLMQITAAAGLAQNFAAVRSLVTTGIQQGHMKMHLLNILNQVGAAPEEKDRLVNYFKDKTVSYNAVVEALENHRNAD